MTDFFCLEKGELKALLAKTGFLPVFASGVKAALFANAHKDNVLKRCISKV